MSDGQPPPGIPGWDRAPCLGDCGREVRERNKHLVLGGMRDGSYVIAMPSWPGGRAKATDMMANPGALGAEMLGVAHVDCADRARARIEMRLIEYPEVLPTLTGMSPDDN